MRAVSGAEMEEIVRSRLIRNELLNGPSNVTHGALADYGDAARRTQLLDPILSGQEQVIRISAGGDGVPQLVNYAASGASL